MISKEDARRVIDNADREIVRILSEFNPVSGVEYEENASRVPKSVEIMMEERAVPVQLVHFIARHINLDNMPSEKVNRKLEEISAHIADRFEAVTSVVEDKMRHGAQVSYDPERHDAVINRARHLMDEFGGDTEKIAEIYESLTAFFVNAQTRYIKQHTGPISEFLQKEEQRTCQIDLM